MRVALMVILVLATALSPVAPTRADGPAFHLVVHPSNRATVLDRRFVADVFLKKRTRWSDDEQVSPVDQSPRASPRARFSQAVLGRPVASVRRYWTQLVFSGRGVPPLELDGDRAVISYVASHPGAIGYVSNAAELAGVKVVRLE
jgi:ABC-type phosphate transport system substrate-binding protein